MDGPIARYNHVTMIPFGKRPKKLPAVLGADEVDRLLQCVTCLKHRMLLDHRARDSTGGSPEALDCGSLLPLLCSQPAAECWYWAR